jgi:hypothetical protein
VHSSTDLITKSACDELIKIVDTKVVDFADGSDEAYNLSLDADAQMTLDKPTEMSCEGFTSIISSIETVTLTTRDIIECRDISPDLIIGRITSTIKTINKIAEVTCDIISSLSKSPYPLTEITRDKITRVTKSISLTLEVARSLISHISRSADLLTKMTYDKITSLSNSIDLITGVTCDLYTSISNTPDLITKETLQKIVSVFNHNFQIRPLTRGMFARFTEFADSQQDTPDSISLTPLTELVREINASISIWPYLTKKEIKKVSRKVTKNSRVAPVSDSGNISGNNSPEQVKVKEKRYRKYKSEAEAKAAKHRQMLESHRRGRIIKSDGIKLMSKTQRDMIHYLQHYVVEDERDLVLLNEQLLRFKKSEISMYW